MASHDIKGSMTRAETIESRPYPGAGKYFEGVLVRYGTPRWHSGGMARFRLDTIFAPGTSWFNQTGNLSNLGINLGLRRADGTQVAWVKFATGERGIKNFNTSFPAGHYYLNARMRMWTPVGDNGNPKYQFEGVLHLGVNPV